MCNDSLEIAWLKEVITSFTLRIYWINKSYFSLIDKRSTLTVKESEDAKHAVYLVTLHIETWARNSINIWSSTLI